MTYCFPAAKFTPEAVSSWCKRHGFAAIRGKLVGGVYRVQVRKIAISRKRRRRNPASPAIGSRFTLRGRPVVVLAHGAEGRLAVHFEDADPYVPGDFDRQEWAWARASDLTPAKNPRRRSLEDPRNAGLAQQVAELRALVAKLERAKRSTKKATGGARGGTFRRIPFSSNPGRRKKAKGKGTVIYPTLEAIEARKPNGQLYRHDFKTKPAVIGESDGSLWIPRKTARLWGMR